MKSYEGQIQVINEKTKKPEWVSIKCSGETAPYRFPTKRQAQRMLESCYAHATDKYRVIEVNYPSNIDIY